MGAHHTPHISTFRRLLVGLVVDMSEQDFDAALAYVTRGPKINLSNAQRLRFYGLYKQITAGPCRVEGPSRFKVTARLKWNAWKKMGTTSKKAARKMYVEELTALVPNWRTWNQ